MLVALGLLVLHGLLAGVATVEILRGAATREDRRRQVLFTWLLPFLGPVVTISIHRSDRDTSRPTLSDRELGSSYEESRYSGSGHDPPHH